MAHRQPLRRRCDSASATTVELHPPALSRRLTTHRQSRRRIRKSIIFCLALSRRRKRRTTSIYPYIDNNGGSNCASTIMPKDMEGCETAVNSDPRSLRPSTGSSDSADEGSDQPSSKTFTIDSVRLEEPNVRTAQNLGSAEEPNRWNTRDWSAERAECL
uniref:Uncharacterized protein n=1 Tax=Ananas comosus var. bracteatus TaxID=296719 RepID=A0A6V7QA02_ANACO|nr:unnamed protein product [Ananas comosus var. bracteatus]